MPNQEAGLTHEEIWDDSALVNSWNDALEEYKKYHSIHTTGGNVDELLNPRTASTSDAKKDRILPEQPVSEGGVDTDKNRDDRSGNSNIQHSQPPTDKPAVIPAQLLGSVRDESLKKLLMSWYYAGYYTGLYEGQQSQPS